MTNSRKETIIIVITTVLTSMLLVFLITRYDLLNMDRLKEISFFNKNNNINLDYQDIKNIDKGKVSNSLVINGTLGRSENRIYGSYDEFDGAEIYSIDFGEPVVNLKLGSSNISGDIRVELINLKTDEKILEWSNPLDVNQSLNIESENTYGIKLIGDKHSGDIDVYWD